MEKLTAAQILKINRENVAKLPTAAESGITGENNVTVEGHQAVTERLGGDKAVAEFQEHWVKAGVIKI